MSDGGREPGPTDEAEPAKGAAKAGSEAPAKPPGRMQQLIFEYGAIGIVTLLSISALTWLGFAAAFMAGFEVDGAGEAAGAFAAASAGWLLTKPIRIPLAIVLTPVVAAVWHRIRGKGKPEADAKGDGASE